MHSMDDAFWDAVRSCDETYNGIFFYAVKSTGIFCRPSCKSRTPLKSNVLFFPFARMAMEEGFRPCKRCRPHLLEMPNEALPVECAKEIIENEYTTSLTLDRLAKRVGISKYYLQRSFKRKYGLSPMEFLADNRMLQAVHMLMNDMGTITEIALSLGYNSSSHFSVAFKNHYGCSPTQYRYEYKEVIRN